MVLYSNECHILKVLYGQFKGNHVEMYNDWEPLFQTARTNVIDSLSEILLIIISRMGLKAWTGW